MTKILLVEDNEMNRDMLLRRLERRGFDVSVAVDGAESIDMVQRDRPDLILMDMSLPVMDGYQATRILKENPQTRSIPVLGLSAHAMTGDAERALDAGCDDYDTKPVEIKRLLGKIDSLLESAGGAESAEAPRADAAPPPAPSSSSPPRPSAPGPPPPPVPPSPSASPPPPPPPPPAPAEESPPSSAERSDEGPETSEGSRYSTVPLPPVRDESDQPAEPHRTVVLPSDWEESAGAESEDDEASESEDGGDERGPRREPGSDEG